jgi:hypothetical protein
MKQLIAYTLLLLLCACEENKEVKQPTNLIHQELFIDVLSEIQIAESAYLKSTDKPKKKKERLALDTKAILAEFNIEATAFDSSMLYYQQKPAVMLAIYDSVIVRLENKLSNMENNKAN